MKFENIIKLALSILLGIALAVFIAFFHGDIVYENEI